MRIAAIINGSAKSAFQTHNEFVFLEGVKIFFTEKASDTQLMAVQAQEEGFELVIIAGGDGTVNQVVNAWVGNSTYPIPVIALYPIGSANDLARTVGFKNVRQLIINAKKGLVVPTDLIEIKTKSRTWHCVNISNCGIGANIAKTVAIRRNKMSPKINYLSATVSWLLKFEAPKVLITASEFETETYTFLTAIGNGRYAGDGLGLCPQAKINDGKMAISIIGKVGLIDFIRYLPKLRLGVEIDDPRVTYQSTTNIRMKVLTGSLMLEADGEPVDELSVGESVEFNVLEAKLRIVKPY
jgi:diacylglycerol kinase (ATP)